MLLSRPPLFEEQLIHQFTTLRLGSLLSGQHLCSQTPALRRVWTEAAAALLAARPADGGRNQLTVWSTQTSTAAAPCRELGAYCRVLLRLGTGNKGVV